MSCWAVVFCVYEKNEEEEEGEEILEMKCDVDVDVAFGVEGWWWRREEESVFC